MRFFNALLRIMVAFFIKFYVTFKQIIKNLTVYARLSNRVCKRL
jgi:hypothetical protein